MNRFEYLIRRLIGNRPTGELRLYGKRLEVQCLEVSSSQQHRAMRLTVVCEDNRVWKMANSVSKIQIGQLWKKDGTGDTYLVTRVYSEALSTMATLRKSGSETEALVRVKVERTAEGQTLVGFSPAQEDERF